MKAFFRYLIVLVILSLGFLVVLEVTSQKDEKKENHYEMKLEDPNKNIEEPLSFNYVEINSTTYSGLMITGVKGKEKEITIPDSFEGKPVVVLGAYAFSNMPIVEKVILNKNLKEISLKTFMNCYNLKEVLFNDGLFEIGEKAFMNCDLLKLQLPKSLRNISNEAFSGNINLKEVNFNFHKDGYYHIGKSLFKACKNLNQITLNEANINYDLMLKDSNVYEIISNDNLDTSLPVIKNINDSKLKVIDDYLIYDNQEVVSYLGNESEITLPNYDSFSPYTYYEDDIFKLTLSKKLVDDEFLNNMNYLKYVIDPFNSEIINHGYFEVINDSSLVNILNEDNFYYVNKLIDNKDYNLLIGVKNLKHQHELIIPNYINELNLSIKTSEGVSYQELTRITLSDEMEVLKGFNLFGLRSLDTLIMGSGLKEIKEDACNSLKNLNRVILNKGIEKIDKKAFNNCNQILEVYNPSKLKFKCGDLNYGNLTLNAVVISNENHFITRLKFKSDAVIYNNGKGDYLALYQGLSGSKYELTLSDNYKGVLKNAFKGKTLKKLILNNAIDLKEDSLKGLEVEVIDCSKALSLNEKAFKNSEAKKIILNENLKEIPLECFYNAKVLEVNLTNNLKIIGKRAFMNTVNLNHLNLSDNLKVIDDEAFRNSGLNEANLKNITKLGAKAFYGAKNLRNVSLSLKLDTIPEGAFSGCEALMRLVIPDNVLKINNYAFHNTPRLLQVTLGKNLKEVSSTAFKNTLVYEIINYSNLDLKEEKYFDLTHYAYSNLKNNKDSIFKDDGDYHYFINETGKRTLYKYTGNDLCNLSEDYGAIFDYAFKDSEVEKIVLNKATTRIYSKAFYGANANAILFAGLSKNSYNEDFNIFHISDDGTVIIKLRLRTYYEGEWALENNTPVIKK